MEKGKNEQGETVNLADLAPQCLYVDYKQLRTDVLTELLDIERARLSEAVRIENERRIVFPETTVIAKDVRRLLDELCGRQAEGVAEAEPGEVEPLDAEITLDERLGRYGSL